MPKTSNIDYSLIFRHLNVYIYKSRTSLLKNSGTQTSELTEHSSAAAVAAPATIPTGELFEFCTRAPELFFFFSFWPLEKYQFAMKKLNRITEKYLLSEQISTTLL